MWFIGVEVEQETSAPPPEKNPGSAPAQGKFASTKQKYYPVVRHRQHIEFLQLFLGCYFAEI